MNSLRVRIEQPVWSAFLVFFSSAMMIFVFLSIIPEKFRGNDNDDYIRFYEPVAQNIITGKGFITGDGQPALRYPPGYPLLIAGTFGLSRLLAVTEETALSGFTIICTSLASVFIYFLARNLWGPLSALMSSLLWVTYPFVLWLTKHPYSEIPFMVFFYAGVYLLWSALLRRSRVSRPYFLSGLLFGLAMLIRPIALGIVIVMSFLLWLMRSELKRAARLSLVGAMLLGNVVAIFPWETWIYHTTGKFEFLSTNGFRSIRDGLTFALANQGGGGCRPGVMVPHDVEILMQDIHNRLGGMGHHVAFADLVSVMTEALQTRPLTVAKLIPLKMVRSWYGTDCQRFPILVILIQIPYLLLISLSTVAAWKKGNLAKQAVVFVWVIVFYFWSMNVLVLSSVRYMVPAIGLLFVLVPALSYHRRAKQKTVSGNTPTALHLLRTGR